MFLNKNIKTSNRNALYHLMIGLIFSGMAVWVASKGISKPNGIDQFDWIYIVIFGLVGLRFVFKGMSFILRKAYIRVDDEKIAFKPDETTQSETIYWKDILAINQVGKNYEIEKRDQTTSKIHFSYFDYEHAKELKEAINVMATEKGILIKKSPTEK